jgi:hypothetical protein
MHKNQTKSTVIFSNAHNVALEFTDKWRPIELPCQKGKIQMLCHPGNAAGNSHADPAQFVSIALT